MLSRRIETNRLQDNERFLENCGLDTALAYGASVHPSKSIRGYSTTGERLKFETVRWLGWFPTFIRHAGKIGRITHGMAR